MIFKIKLTGDRLAAIISQRDIIMIFSGDGVVIEITSQGRVEFLGSISAKGKNPGEVVIDAPTVINKGVIDH